MEGNYLESMIEDISSVEDETINISDVIEVIETDFKESTMFGGGEVRQSHQPASMQQPQQQHRQRHLQNRHGAFVKIIEQPASKALRFRYECEGRSAGSIPGASSTSENKVYPAIQVCGYQGRAVVVVSCVTKDPPYRPHPHNLVGREGCKKGVCTMEISPETMCVTFSNLGIQCVKKKDIENALKTREEIKVDPYMTGFSHRSQPTSIDLNAVRLCFQVFLEGDRGKFTIPLTPVVSEPIYDKKAMSDLIIIKLSHCCSCVDGSSKDIILLCEKVAKEDIQVRFFEEKDGQVEWEGFGEFQPSQVHKQTAIWFRAPRYKTIDITEPVKVFIQLRRPSDGASSEALPFQFLPLDAEPGRLKRKRLIYDESNPIFRRAGDLQTSNATRQFLRPLDTIKIEPRDKSPSPYGGQTFVGNTSPAYLQNQTTSTAALTTTLNIPFDNTQLLPPMETWNIQSSSQQQQQHQWGFSPTPLTPSLTNDLNSPSSAMNLVDNSASGLSSLLDLDSQQLRQIEINSGELNVFDTNNLSETFTTNLSLTDVTGVLKQDNNMTDSLTRFANSTLDNM